jgi:hypothetical protein
LWAGDPSEARGQIDCSYGARMWGGEESNLQGALARPGYNRVGSPSAQPPRGLLDTRVCRGRGLSVRSDIGVRRPRTHGTGPRPPPRLFSGRVATDRLSCGRSRDAGWVPEAVDPSPIIDEKLKVLAKEHEPRIDALYRAASQAGSDDLRRLKTELRRAKRAYASARREVEKLRGPGVAW